MTKAQLICLNVMGCLLALLILCNLILVPWNTHLGQTLQQTQNQINQAQQFQTTYQSLAVRIAQAAQTEPTLRELMVQHDLKVNLEADNQANPTP